jgi:hypothetical protein
VIAGIIVGSIIILSIVGCLISCLCCGYQCCKGCCGCCYECCSCCGGSNHRGRSKYADAPAPYYQQPPPPQSMHYGDQPPTAPLAPPAYRGPQTAQFNHSKPKPDDDSLPAMPTWADASTRRIEDHSPVHEEVEMDDLEARDQPNGGMVAPAGRMSRGGYAELAGAATSPQPSPRPMYNEGHAPHDGYQNNSGYRGNGGYRGAETGYFNKPRSPGPPSPGYPPRASPRASPAPYRGLENQPPPRVPNFNSPRAYDRLNSPTPPTAAAYSPYESAAPTPPAPVQAHSQQYRAFSPSIPSTPPPPFSETEQPGNDRPPTLLMAGRRPVPNTWRNV